MNRTKTALIGASALAAGAIIASGVNLATAATGDGQDARSGQTPGYGFPGRGADHDHTTVTGSAETEVADAVKAKYADVTVTTVLQDPDGSYDVMGTQSGNPVMLQVSKDLETVELRTGGPSGAGDRGPGGAVGRSPGDGDRPDFGGHDHTTVTGSTKTKVVDAVVAKYADVTVTTVLQDPDGSYDVMGTESGNPVMLQASKDLKTIELESVGPDGHHGFGGRDGDAAESGSTGTSTAPPSTT